VLNVSGADLRAFPIRLKPNQTVRLKVSRPDAE
jgi:hypothetical protein